MTFQGQTAIVTGGASGIGRALCARLLDRGARVILGDIDATAAEETARTFSANGEIIALPIDVADEQSVQAFAAAAFARAPRIDLLFNNAGVSAVGALHTTSAQTWDWLTAVNLTGMVRVIRAFAPRMVESTAPARIINMASSLALGPPDHATGVSAYAALKHAVIGLSEALRADLAETAVGVHVACPGMVQSDLWNAARHRHPAFGGPKPGHAGFKDANAKGLDALSAADRILDAVAAGEFYCLTHGADSAPALRRRQDDIAAALAGFAARYGAEA